MPTMLLTAAASAAVGFVLLVLPLLIGPPIARWLTRLGESWLRLEGYRRRRHGPAANWVLAFLGYGPFGRREYGAAAEATPRPLAAAAIEPGRGFGPARLGMSPAEVEAALGRSLGGDAWDDGNLNDSLVYDGLRLRFDECDGRGPAVSSRLCEAEVRRADAVLFGRPMADWGEHELAAELAGRCFRPRLSEPGYAEYARPYLRVWSDNGRLIRVEIAAEETATASRGGR